MASPGAEAGEPRKTTNILRNRSTRLRALGRLQPRCPHEDEAGPNIENAQCGGERSHDALACRESKARVENLEGGIGEEHPRESFAFAPERQDGEHESEEYRSTGEDQGERTRRLDRAARQRSLRHDNEC